MTRTKLCGLWQIRDIVAANEVSPDFVGFVFAQGSTRYVSPEHASALRKLLSPGIKAVGVFVDESPEMIAALLNQGIIDLAQLHGHEDEAYIDALRNITDKPLIKAVRVHTAEDIEEANQSTADHVLLDSGTGTGRAFDWSLLKHMTRPYFLAGGLTPDNVAAAVRRLRPFAVDVSSGIETEGKKDKAKMTAFQAAVQEVNDR